MFSIVCLMFSIVSSPEVKTCWDTKLASESNHNQILTLILDVRRIACAMKICSQRGFSRANLMEFQGVQEKARGRDRRPRGAQKGENVFYLARLAACQTGCLCVFLI